MVKIMFDEVKNPWRKRRGVVVFDIETNRSEDWSTFGKQSRVFKCGVAYEYDKGKYREFRDPKKFVLLLKKAKTLVSYNGEGFDFLVLSKYGLQIRKHRDRWRPERIESFDLMHKIVEIRPKRNRRKKYPKLEELMYLHYGVRKPPYRPEYLRELIGHCRKDVEFTKRLYEEKTWLVPIKERRTLKRRWENYYDDDISGAIWDGENWTYVRDFGMPIRNPISAEAKMSCPVCGAKGLSLKQVVRLKESRIFCPQCGTVITFSPANDIVSIQSKKKYESSNCKNCGERIEASDYAHYGYGAGHGYLSSGRSICPVCSKGCYEWSDDDTPGFREHWKGTCCRCKRDIGDWYLKESQRTGRK